MIVQCPQCEKRYKVEDSEVPISGAAVRCPKCTNIFTIYREVSPIELVPLEAEAEVAKETFAPSEPPPPPVQEEPFVAPEPPVTEEPPSTGIPGMEAAVTPSAVAPPPELEKPPTEGVEDEKHQDARQLARALVKDIVLYHKDRVEEGLQKGTLVQLVGDEIRKSWSFYREQIPPDVLKNSDYFKEALNEILAKGKQIFT
jgi:predicted Zn finger-like uncharacterized protein